MFKKVYSLYSAFYPSLRFTLSLQSAFYTQSAFYPWSAVCSLQAAVCVLHWPEGDPLQWLWWSDSVGFVARARTIPVHKRHKTVSIRLRGNISQVIMLLILVTLLVWWDFQKENERHFRERARGRVEENLCLFSRVIRAFHEPKSSSPAPSLSASLNFFESGCSYYCRAKVVRKA